MVDWTGAITGAQTFANGDRVTGNVTVGAGATVTVTAGATITFTGDFNITVSSSGKFVATGTATSRITFKSSSATPTASDWSYIFLNAVTSTGNSFQYCTVNHNNHQGGGFILSFGTGGTITVKNNIHTFIGGSGCSVWNTNSGAVGITFENIEVEGVYGSTNGGIFINDTSAASHIIKNCKLTGNFNGIDINTAGTTLTIQDSEFRSCTNGVYINAATTNTINRCLFFDVEESVDASITSTTTVQNCFFTNSMAANSYGLVARGTSTTPALTISNNIIGGSKRSLAIPIYQTTATGQRITSSGNDIGGASHTTAATGIFLTDTTNGSTSDDDAIFGCATADLTNFDTSNATTSTETPKQYQNLTNARTNARSALKWPITIDTISFTATGDGATATWNSNRPMNSEVYLAEVTGVDPDTPSTYDICFIQDDDWSNISGRGTYKDKSTGQIGTAHSVTIAGLKAGTQYFYIVRGVDPAGNVAESTEGNFTTTGAVPSVSGASYDDAAITTEEYVTVTATITNTPLQADCVINSKHFRMTNTSGNTWSTGAISGGKIGTVTSNTGVVHGTNASGGGQGNTSNALTVTAATSATIYTSTWNTIFNLINDNVTDPDARTQKWVFATFPDTKDRKLTNFLPLIVIDPADIASEEQTMSRGHNMTNISIPIKVYSKSATELDRVSDRIYDGIQVNIDELDTAGLRIAKIDVSSPGIEFVNGIKIHTRTINLVLKYYHT